MYSFLKSIFTAQPDSHKHENMTRVASPNKNASLDIYRHEAQQYEDPTKQSHTTHVIETTQHPIPSKIQVDGPSSSSQEKNKDTKTTNIQQPDLSRYILPSFPYPDTTVWNMDVLGWDQETIEKQKLLFDFIKEIEYNTQRSMKEISFNEKTKKSHDIYYRSYPEVLASQKEVCDRAITRAQRDLHNQQTKWNNHDLIRSHNLVYETDDFDMFYQHVKQNLETHRQLLESAQASKWAIESLHQSATNHTNLSLIIDKILSLAKLITQQKKEIEEENEYSASAKAHATDIDEEESKRSPERKTEEKHNTLRQNEKELHSIILQWNQDNFIRQNQWDSEQWYYDDFLEHIKNIYRSTQETIPSSKTQEDDELSATLHTVPARISRDTATIEHQKASTESKGLQSLIRDDFLSQTEDSIRRFSLAKMCIFNLWIPNYPHIEDHNKRDFLFYRKIWESAKTEADSLIQAWNNNPTIPENMKYNGPDHQAIKNHIEEISQQNKIIITHVSTLASQFQEEQARILNATNNLHLNTTQIEEDKPLSDDTNNDLIQSPEEFTDLFISQITSLIQTRDIIHKIRTGEITLRDEKILHHVKRPPTSTDDKIWHDVKRFLTLTNDEILHGVKRPPTPTDDEILHDVKRSLALTNDEIKHLKKLWNNSDLVKNDEQLRYIYDQQNDDDDQAFLSHLLQYKDTLSLK